MLGIGRWILISMALVIAATPLRGANAADRAFNAAVKFFQDTWWENAENEFAQFAQKFPKSERRAEAILRQAQARYQLTNSTEAVELLSANLNQAGKLADEYQFWLAAAHFQNSNYQAAAQASAQLVKDYPNSTHCLEASYNEALAHSKLQAWPRVIELLREPTGAFQKFAQLDPANEIVTRGVLLLGETYLSESDFGAAEETLQPLAERKLKPELDWRRQYLLCRIQLADGRPEEASQGATNLLELAMASGQRSLQAESAAFQAGTKEQLNRLDEAIAFYEKNLIDDLPVERRRQALLKITELTLAQNKTSEAIQRLEKFLNQYPTDATADEARLALGELYLKGYLTQLGTNRVESAGSNAPAATNQLQQAFAQFELLVKDFPQSPLVGKAHLNRGWCLWIAGQISSSQTAFQIASERLPFSDDQAVAHLKLADCQFRQTNFAGALVNYSLVIDRYASLARVKDELLEPALYQSVRASLETGDLAGATNALARILDWYPSGFLCDRSMLLVGQKLGRGGNPAEARKVFADALKRFPGSPLAPEVELAIARTYEQEKDWTAAIKQYDAWVTNFANHEARPRAEYYRAWASYQAGQETNALTRFTSFVSEYSTNELAPLAQYWVADFYRRQEDFVNAEKNYQLLFQNPKWPPSELTYQAQMMAGRAAMARDSLSDADRYFTNLINNLQAPPEVVAQALFAHGDVIMGSAEAIRPYAKFEEAISIFNKLQQLYPTNALVPLAWGRIGDCFQELGAHEPKHYDEALRFYQQVIESLRASISARSEAEVKSAIVLEKQAQQKTGLDQTQLLKLSLTHYLNVVLGANLREEEKPDPFWIKKAGLAGGRLAEELQEWEPVANLYARVADMVPPLRASLESKIKKARERLQQRQN